MNGSDKLLASVIATTFGLAVEAVERIITEHRRTELEPNDLPKTDEDWDDASKNLLRKG